MSRIGKQKVPLPTGVTAKQELTVLSIQGPKGALSQVIHPLIHLQVDPDGIRLKKENESRQADALSGLTRTLVANMVKGVSDGFSRELEIVGVGYRAELSGKSLVFQLGYSHKINFPLPEGITAEVPKPTQVILRGIDNSLLGLTAARIRNLRKPEPYKGKGIKYTGEFIRRKVGKSGTK
jgi:large subunit ribosomal protein L6